jgi:hypothetical protein
MKSFVDWMFLEIIGIGNHFESGDHTFGQSFTTEVPVFPIFS